METETKLKLEKADIARLAFRVCNFYRHKAAWKKIEIHAELQPDCCFAWTDRVAVAVVFDNLLSNALKFSENGKQIYVSVRSEKDQIIFSVSDEGPGLSVEDQSRLFQKGVRLSNSPTAGESTLGYGLAIAKDLVEKLWRRHLVRKPSGARRQLPRPIACLQGKRLRFKKRLGCRNGQVRCWSFYVQFIVGRRCLKLIFFFRAGG